MPPTQKSSGFPPNTKYELKLFLPERESTVWLKHWKFLFQQEHSSWQLQNYAEISFLTWQRHIYTQMTHKHKSDVNIKENRCKESYIYDTDAAGNHRGVLVHLCCQYYERGLFTQ